MSTPAAIKRGALVLAGLALLVVWASWRQHEREKALEAQRRHAVEKMIGTSAADAQRAWEAEKLQKRAASQTEKPAETATNGTAK